MWAEVKVNGIELVLTTDPAHSKRASERSSRRAGTDRGSAGRFALRPEPLLDIVIPQSKLDRSIESSAV